MACNEFYYYTVPQPLIDWILWMEYHKQKLFLVTKNIWWYTILSFPELNQVAEFLLECMDSIKQH